MILLYTDFGWCGPYVGQMKATLKRLAARTAVVDLMHDAPRFRPREAGILLAAQLPWLPPTAVIIAVVDPEVGGDRRALVARVGRRWLVGPDNGLLAPALAADPDRRVWSVPVPAAASPSFHGRDVFAPVGARVGGTGMPTGSVHIEDWEGREDPPEMGGVIYIDGFGNVMTGRYAAGIADREGPVIGGRPLPRGRTFCDVLAGQAFWYENSIGLVEIAVNQGSAADMLGLAVGDPVTFGHHHRREEP